jgi:hypothetical protein
MQRSNLTMMISKYLDDNLRNEFLAENHRMSILGADAFEQNIRIASEISSQGL